MRAIILILGLLLSIEAASQSDERVLSCSFKSGETTVIKGRERNLYFWTLYQKEYRFYRINKVKAITIPEAAKTLFKNNLIFSCEKLAKLPRLSYIVSTKQTKKNQNDTFSNNDQRTQYSKKSI